MKKAILILAGIILFSIKAVRANDLAPTLFSLSLEAYLKILQLGAVNDRFAHSIPTAGWLREMRRQLASMVGGEENLKLILFEAEDRYYFAQDKAIGRIIASGSAQEKQWLAHMLSSVTVGKKNVVEYLAESTDSFRNSDQYRSLIRFLSFQLRRSEIKAKLELYRAIGLPVASRFLVNSTALAILEPDASLRDRLPRFQRNDVVAYYYDPFEQIEIIEAVMAYIRSVKSCGLLDENHYRDNWDRYVQAEAKGLNTSGLDHSVHLSSVIRKYGLPPGSVLGAVAKFVASQKPISGTESSSLASLGEFLLAIPIGISRAMYNFASLTEYTVALGVSPEWADAYFVEQSKGLSWAVLNSEIDDAEAYGLFFEAATVPLLFLTAGSGSIAKDGMLASIKQTGGRELVSQAFIQGRQAVTRYGAKALAKAGGGTLLANGKEITRTAAENATLTTAVEFSLFRSQMSGKAVASAWLGYFTTDLNPINQLKRKMRSKALASAAGSRAFKNLERMDAHRAKASEIGRLTTRAGELEDLVRGNKSLDELSQETASLMKKRAVELTKTGLARGKSSVAKAGESRPMTVASATDEARN